MPLLPTPICPIITSSFFGDSVFGNYQDFASIPGVIGALTEKPPFTTVPSEVPPPHN